MKEIKAKLETIQVTGVSSDRSITITANGNGTILGMEIGDAQHTQSEEMLKKNILEAVNEAVAEAHRINESEMKAAAGSMLPGLGGMFNQA